MAGHSSISAGSAKSCGTSVAEGARNSTAVSKVVCRTQFVIAQ